MTYVAFNLHCNMLVTISGLEMEKHTVTCLEFLCKYYGIMYKGFFTFCTKDSLSWNLGMGEDLKSIPYGSKEQR